MCWQYYSSKKKGHSFRFGTCTLNGNGQYAYDDYLYIAIAGELDAFVVTEPYVNI